MVELHEKTEHFKKGIRYYLNTEFGMIKVFVDGGMIVIQFWKDDNSESND